MDGFRNEQNCPICGKLYYVARYNKYKITLKYFEYGIVKYKKKNVCSYGCMRKWEVMQNENRKAGKPKDNRNDA